MQEGIFINNINVNMRTWVRFDQSIITAWAVLPYPDRIRIFAYMP